MHYISAISEVLLAKIILTAVAYREHSGHGHYTFSLPKKYYDTGNHSDIVHDLWHSQVETEHYSITHYCVEGSAL